jgi:titin
MLSVSASGFLANDLDPEGGAVTASVITDGVDNGTLSAFADGRFTYTPDPGFSGTDSFTYRARDDAGKTAEATVFITVLENLPPVALDDSYSVAEGGTLNVAAAFGFLQNDADPEGGAVTATVITDGVDNGTLSAFADGGFNYTPNPGFVGTDSFVYRVRDDDQNFSEATVTINVVGTQLDAAAADAYAPV